MKEEASPLSRIFYPKSIAVFGVSPQKGNMGRTIVQNTLNLGFKGEVFSIGRTQGVAFGQKIYLSLDEIDRDIDLAVILTPAKTIPDILEQCGRRGIKAAVIESGGFSEFGPEGKALEKGCIEAAARYGLRFIGPNGIGVTNLESGVATPFVNLRRDLCIGPVSILAQSGGVGLAYLNFLSDERIGFNKFVSMGNKLNINENDLLEYLIQDPGTRIILVYVEGFKDGRRFVEVASHSDKPILVHKSNRHETSARIAHSHTTAMFTNDRLVDHALEQAGCVRVDTIGEAIHYIKSLSLPPLKGKRLGLVSRSGGHAVIAADACGYYGFELPSFPREMLERIAKHVRAGVIRLQNPLDLGDVFELDFYAYIVEELLQKEDLDGVLLGHEYRQGPEQQPSRALLHEVDRLVEKYQKPVAVFMMTEASEREYFKNHVKIPVFEAPEIAMRAMHLSYEWSSRRPLPPLKTRPEHIDEDRARAILDRAKGEGRLLLSEGIELIKAYGFAAARHGLARRAEEAVQIWRAWNMPVAMKVNRPHLSHKSEQGAVRLNLHAEDEIHSAFGELEGMAGPDLEVLVQEMAPKGREIILGGKRDECFGPVVLFGLGGIFVELFQDAVWRLAPIQNEEAGRMIRTIKGARVLQGYRGEGPRDVEALKDLLVRLSQMLVTFPQIQEIDINPVIVMAEGKGALAVDARVILEEDQ